ncbi:hypothetical protein JHK84_052704 [Glycine max]|nr:hypothetical protein JHK84_052704 [Glycine max]
MEVVDNFNESLIVEVVEDSFEGLGMEEVDDFYESVAVEVVEDSFEGLEIEECCNGGNGRFFEGPSMEEVKDSTEGAYKANDSLYQASEGVPNYWLSLLHYDRHFAMELSESFVKTINVFFTFQRLSKSFVKTSMPFVETSTSSLHFKTSKSFEKENVTSM